MHAATFERSPRLQRVHALLRDGEERSTMDIVLNAQVMAVSAVVSELRHHGAEIECRQDRAPGGGRIWLYRMTRPIGDQRRLPLKRRAK